MLKKILKQIAIELLLKWLQKLGQDQPVQEPTQTVLPKKSRTKKTTIQSSAASTAQLTIEQ